MHKHSIYQNPILIESTRLLLYPLTYPQLRKFLQNNLSLERELQLSPHQYYLSDFLTDLIEDELLEQVHNHPHKYIYYTLWIIIRKEDFTIVGNLNCKGEPSFVGEVEIGYETTDEFQNNGYMTEALASFCQWLTLSCKEVVQVLAITNYNNDPSIAVLQKNTFVATTRAGDTIRWEKRLRSTRDALIH